MTRLADALIRAAAQGKPAEPLRHTEHSEDPFAPAWDLDLDRSVAEESAERSAAHASRPLIERRKQEERLQAPAALAPKTDTTPTIRLDSQLAMSWPHPFSGDVVGKLVLTPQINPVAVEQYRKIASALNQAQHERGLKTLIVASAVAGEGRTLTAANIALTLSETHRRRVLLVDANLRQPRMHELFQVSAGSGLNGYLRSPEGPIPAVELTATLALLPAGRPEPDAESVFSSARVGKVLSEFAASYDWVVLDTAPAAEQPDVGILSRFVDGAVLVVDAGKTPRDLIDRAVEVLGRDRLLGVVLNRATDAAVAATQPVPVATTSPASIRLN